MRLLHFQGQPIQDQLKMEEELLRNTQESLCIINEGSSPAIVMGISGKEEEFVCPIKIKQKPIPVLKRFSGGGTVIVDHNTLFVTFICLKDAHPFPAYPEPILRWAETVYKQAFDLPSFALKDNDFVLGEKKCGGNAQYIRKTHWLIHTSFLWDYDEENMEYLLHPKKTPAYRQGRSHNDFLCKLKDHFPSKEALVLALKKEINTL